MRKPKHIEIDDILKGYNSFQKLKEIYYKIREGVLTENPIHTSPKGLVVVGNTSREESYSFEIHRTNNYEVFLEAWGVWKGYVHEPEEQPEISGATLRHIGITIFRDDRGMVGKSIENIVSFFPRESKKP